MGTEFDVEWLQALNMVRAMSAIPKEKDASNCFFIKSPLNPRFKRPRLKQNKSYRFAGEQKADHEKIELFQEP